jgi:predicted dehydrogenase
MKKVRFGLIGCGLMGREFASAIARWCHLPDIDVGPELVAICDRFDRKPPDLAVWFTKNFPSLRQVSSDYRQLLANPEVEAVYCAVPHNMHQEFYCAAIESGKHLMGEKPFGIDKPANQAILASVRIHPELLHSSDLDPNKPIDWKREVDVNGEYGCMGDLGMHACHVPFRAGWRPLNVRAILSNIVTERPDGKGGRVPCRTWDNATLFCEAECAANREVFPLTIKTQRIAPGEKNNWYLEVLGTSACAKFSTKNPRRLELLEYQGGRQTWQQVDMGQETAFKSITGGIFEFGFSDAILQMWAGYVYELMRGQPLKPFAGCVTPEETALSHQLFTAALESQRLSRVVSLS